MTTMVFLAELQASGVRVAIIAPDRLRVEAPYGVVTPEVRATLAQHKADIIAELRRRAFFGELAGDPDAWCEFENQMEERAAILEFDGGLSHGEATAQAEVMTADLWPN